jgi:hypothetical protein
MCDVIYETLLYQNKEECDKESHPAGNNVWFDKKGDPGDDDKHESWKVNLNQELHDLSL